MKKTLIITYDVITQDTEIENPDELNVIEFLGLIETAKFIMMTEED